MIQPSPRQPTDRHAALPATVGAYGEPVDAKGNFDVKALFERAIRRPAIASELRTPEIERQITAVLEFQRAARNANTYRAYVSDWKQFAAYCARHKFTPAFPASPSYVAMYLGGMSQEERSERTGRTLRPATIRRRLSVIGLVHDIAGVPSPVSDTLVVDTWKGIRKQKGTAPLKKTAVSFELLEQMLQPYNFKARNWRKMDQAQRQRWELTRLRARAILLLGFATALRRTNLATILYEHLDFDLLRLRILIPQSKTDQLGRGRYVSIRPGEHKHLDPVRALRKWLNRAKITHGPVFRKIDRYGNVSGALRTTRDGKTSPNSLSAAIIANVIKEAVERVGLDPRSFAGHSLRRGFITHSVKSGKHIETISHQTWQTRKTIFDYIEEEGLWDEHPTEGLGF